MVTNKTTKAQTNIDFNNNNSIAFNINITLDNKQIVDTVYKLYIDSKLVNLSNISTSNKYTLYLDYNTVYTIKVSYSNYESKIIIIDTNAPKRKYLLGLNINLNKVSKSIDILAGKLNFNRKSDKWEQLPYSVK